MNAVPARSLLFLPFLLAASCAAPRQTTFQSIELSRTACEGACPVYSVSIAPSGAVVFVSDKNEHKSMLSPSDIQFLSAALTRLESKLSEPGLDEKMRSCLNSVIDAPIAHIKIRRNGRIQMPSYAAYCASFPASRTIDWFADTIDEVAATGRWLEEPDTP